MVGQELAKYISELSYEDLPDEVVYQSKRLLLDTIATIFAGAGEDFTQSISTFISKIDNNPECTIIGREHKAGFLWAAFANAAFSQVHDFNDGHRGSGISLLSASPIWGGCYHAARIVVPTALAVGEKYALSGKEVLTAIVVGLDVAYKIRGVKHRPPAEAYSTAAVAAKLMGLNETEILNATGIAGYMSSGKVGKGPSYSSDYLVHGYFAKTGIEAAMLAAEGCTGPLLYDDSVLSTRFNEKGLWKEFEVMKTYLKPYPACRVTHGAIDAVLALKKEKGLVASDVEEIEIRLVTQGMYVASERLNTSSYYKNCQYNIYYSVACALIDGEVSLKQFTKERIADPRVHEFSRTIKVLPDESLDVYYPDKSPVVVIIRTKDGNTYTQRVDYAKGGTQNPLTDDELLEKFMQCSEKSISEERALYIRDAVFKLDEMPDLTGLVGYMSSTGEKRDEVE
mgnify:CR=1 FL=1